MDDEELSSLVQAAEQLASQLDDGSLGELPRVERNLRQIMEASNQLWIRTSQSGGQENQGAALLGSVGLDLPRVAHKLDVLSTISNFEPLEPIRETDIKGFLKNERENAILAVIEETRRMSFNHAQQMYWDSVKSEWEKEKQQILSALTESGDELLDISLPIAEMTSGGMLPISSRSVLDHQEMAYVKAVMEYNDQTLKGGIKPSLAEKFSQTAQAFNDQNISDIWDMVRMMVDVPVKISGDNILKSRGSALIQKAFMNQGRRYLEDRYKSYIRQTVYSNLGAAKLGGIPGTLPLVRSFVSARQISRTTGLEDGFVDGEPVWPLIFYCLRCGDINAALQASKQAGAVVSEFTRLLEELIHSGDRNLSPSMETNAKLMYKKMIRTSTDPYKRASYCVVAACDVNDDHTEVAQSTDDYLWIKLCQLKEDELAGHDSSHERVTYSQFQLLVLEEYGERHFKAYQEPFLYFEVLFLTGQFEAAIDFFSRIERLRCHAVHVALALFESQFLALPSNVQSPLLSKENSDKSSMRRLNIARLVMLYTRKFEATDPKEALHYFYFLRGIKGSKGDSLFTACVSELVLESRNFDLLLGRLEPDGTRTQGFLNHFKGTQVDTQKIIELVARDSEAKGLHEDAVHLYELAKDDAKVIELLCRLLSGSISQPAAIESESWRVQNKALAFAQRLKASGSLLPNIAATFFLLLDLGIFFSLYHEEKYHEAFETIAKLRLIPLSPDEVESRVSNFRNLSDDIRRNIPDVLLATMNILYKKYKQSKAPRGFVQSRRDDGDTDEFMDQIRKQARALTTFIGMIPYRMPGDTHARLVQLQSMMI